MQIIIPMSGFGERFRKKGYRMPKPMINVAGKEMIKHVVELFPGEKDFIFICNKNHLKKFPIEETLKKLMPSSKIISIESHKKGPVYAVLKAKKYIDLSKPSLINYCDFSMIWDWKFFKNYIEKNKLDGCIPAYKDFHPHSFGKTNYAYLKCKGKKVLKIQEKKPFTEDKIKEYASTGTYYFKDSENMIKIFEKCINEDISTNGEFYCSLPFNYLVEQKKKVEVFNIKYFFQWGTPEDLLDFESSYKSINAYKTNNNNFNKRKTPRNQTILMPMAGKGERFKKEGFETPKPLLKINTSEMFSESLKSWPVSKKSKKIIALNKKVSKLLDKKKYKNIEFMTLNKNTEGQAETVSIMLDKNFDKINDKDIINVAACDSFVSVNWDLVDFDWDLIYWCSKWTDISKKDSSMYSWIDVDAKNNAKNFLYKETPSKFKNPSLITGFFSYKNKHILKELLMTAFKKKLRSMMNFI